MSAYILPNVILFVAVTGLLVLLGRRIPEARRELVKDEAIGKGTRLGIWFILAGYARSMWRFVLEAKGIRSPLGSKLRMKQLLTENKQAIKKTLTSAKSVVSKGLGKTQAKSKHLTSYASEAQLPSHPEVGLVETETILPRAKPVPATQVQVAGPKVVTEMDTMAVVKQLLDNRKYFEARKMLENMGSGMEQNPLFWARLGYAQYHLAGYAEAVKSYEKAIALDSTQPNRYYNLSLAYEGLGNNAKALINLDVALKLDPGNAKYLETRKGLVGT